MNNRIFHLKKNNLMIGLIIFIITGLLLISFYLVTASNIRETIKHSSVSLQNLYLNTLNSSLEDLAFLASLKKDPSLFTKEDDLLLSFLNKHRRYSQARIIDHNGNEVLRINRKKGKVQRVPNEKLQDKSDRYYFKKSMNLPVGANFVSAIDYNVENNVVNKDEITFRVVRKLNDNYLLALNINSDFLVTNVYEKSRFFVTAPASPPVGLSAFYTGKASSQINFNLDDLKNHHNTYFSPWSLWIEVQLEREKGIFFSLLFIQGLISLFLLFLFFQIRSREGDFFSVYQLFSNMVMESALFSVTDKDGLITYVNKNFEKTSGFSLEEMKGQKHAVLESFFKQKESFFDLWTNIEEGNVWVGIVKSLTKEGREYWLNTIISPIKNSQGKIEGFASLGFDVSKEKELEEKVSLLKKHNTLNINRMSAHLAHQFATPMGIIQSAKDISEHILSHDPLRKEDLELQLENTQKAINSIQDITSFIKLLGKKSTTEPSPLSFCNLSEVITHTLKILKKNLDGEKVQFFWNEKELNFIIRSHHTLLMQVFINLITNSIDALRDCKEKIIRLELVKNDDNAVLRYKDSGGGISKEIVENIFTPYYSTKELNEGTGLGLSFTQEVLNYSGGDITYSGDEKETSFDLLFIKSET